MRTLVLVALTLGCSDYELNTKKDHPSPGGTPEARLDGLDGWHCGAGLVDDVVITNDGTADLVVHDIAIEGDWSATLPELPAVIAPAEHLTIPVAGDGDGLVRIVTDDPERPELEATLSARADEPPTLSVLAPASDTVMGQGAPMKLVVEAADDHDPADTLVVSWLSDVDGLLGETNPAADGLAELGWAPAGRTPGPHDLTATVTDSCGHVVALDTPVCQQGGYTEETLDISSWHFEGAANWDSSNAWLQLVPAVQNQVGTAFATDHVVTGDEVEISFDFYIGDGTGADGISLTALDVDRMTTFLGGTGCGIGYGGDAACTSGPALPGWSIEVDTWFNDGQDPTPEDHVMFTFDGDVDGGEVWAALPEMEDNGWHTMEVAVNAPRVTVAIDGVTYIDQPLPGYYAFPAYVGFTAGTGGSTNNHLIDSLTVEQKVCPE